MVRLDGLVACSACCHEAALDLVGILAIFAAADGCLTVALALPAKQL